MKEIIIKIAILGVLLLPVFAINLWAPQFSQENAKKDLYIREKIINAYTSLGNENPQISLVNNKIRLSDSLIVKKGDLACYFVDSGFYVFVDPKTLEILGSMPANSNP